MQFIPPPVEDGGFLAYIMLNSNESYVICFIHRVRLHELRCQRFKAPLSVLECLVGYSVDSASFPLRQPA